MTEIIISIGANTPDAIHRVLEAIDWIKSGADGHLTQAIASEPYSTPEISGRYPDYINAVAKAATDTDAKELSELFKEREYQAGRTPTSKKTGLVPLDIDLLIYGDNILRPRDLTRQYTIIGIRQLGISQQIGIVP